METTKQKKPISVRVSNSDHRWQLIQYLLLEGEDVRDATINWVLEPRLGLVRDCDGSLTPITNGEVGEELWDVAGPKDLVDRREVSCPLFVAEVWCENAAPHAFPPQELAGTARRSRARHVMEFFRYVMCFFTVAISSRRSITGMAIVYKHSRRRWWATEW